MITVLESPVVSVDTCFPILWTSDWINAIFISRKPLYFCFYVFWCFSPLCSSTPGKWFDFITLLLIFYDNIIFFESGNIRSGMECPSRWISFSSGKWIHFISSPLHAFTTFIYLICMYSQHTNSKRYAGILAGQWYSTRWKIPPGRLSSSKCPWFYVQSSKKGGGGVN